MQFHFVLDLKTGIGTTDMIPVQSQHNLIGFEISNLNMVKVARKVSRIMPICVESQGG